MAIFQVNLDHPIHVNFPLPFPRRTFGDKQDRPNTIPVTEPSVLMHQKKLKMLTLPHHYHHHPVIYSAPTTVM